MNLKMGEADSRASSALGGEKPGRDVEEAGCRPILQPCRIRRGAFIKRLGRNAPCRHREIPAKRKSQKNINKRKTAEQD
jgi:hypothetical protein